MAAAMEPFDSFRTPNLFDAGISVDADSYFQDRMDIEKPSDFNGDDSWTNMFTDMRDAPESGAAYAMGTENLSYAPIATPPPSATEPPEHFPFGSHQPSRKMEAQFLANPLNPLTLDTSQASVNAEFNWGQLTPPNDQASPAGQVAPSDEVEIKQEAGDSTKMASTRRKKSDGQVDAPTKRRRSRKSFSTESITGAPVDPVEEERRNRFLERNRVAASKCRQKKKEWTQNLESHARDLHSNNHQLQTLVTSLRDEVMYLRNEMLKHGGCDCQGIRDYLSREADFLASGSSPRSPGSQRLSALNSPRHSIASTISGANTSAGQSTLDSATDGKAIDLKGRKNVTERPQSASSQHGSSEL